MPRKLKVFQAQFGFYDTVVAAPSQAAALRAWDAHQNLFHDGQAREATDDAAIEAALAQPGVPLRRAVGSTDPFSLNPRLPHLPELPNPPAKPKRTKTEGPKQPSKPAPPPDRSALDAAEAALARIDREHLGVQSDFDKRRAALEAEEKAAMQRYAEHRTAATAAVERARQAYVRAGGRDGA